MVASHNYFVYDPGVPVELTSTPSSETFRAISTAHARVNRVLAEEMVDETGLPLDRYKILLMLTQTESGRMRASDIAHNVGLSRSGTTRLIDRLERDGLVVRQASRHDGRGTDVGLTTSGEKAFRSAGRVHLRGIDEHVGGHLTDSELNRLTRLLDKLASAFPDDYPTLARVRTTR